MSEPLVVWAPSGGPFVAFVERAVQSPITLHCDDTVPDAARRIEVLVSGTPDPAWLDALPALRTVIIPYAGVPPKTVALLERYPHLGLHNLHHNAEPTAEMALALLLAVAKRVVPADRQLRRGDWRSRHDEPRAWTLARRKAIVFGWGAIGQRVGRMLQALGMQVCAVGRTARVDASGTTVVAAAALDPALAGAEVLIITAPATPHTRGLFDAGRLALLARGALVVNVARGTLVEEAALYEALQRGQVGGAGLDVWWRYPRNEAERSACEPANHPFQAMEQVVFSPHRGGLTVETERLRGEGLAALLDQAARGEPLANRVGREAGY